MAKSALLMPRLSIRELVASLFLALLLLIPGATWARTNAKVVKTQQSCAAPKKSASLSFQPFQTCQSGSSSSFILETAKPAVIISEPTVKSGSRTLPTHRALP